MFEELEQRYRRVKQVRPTHLFQVYCRAAGIQVCMQAADAYLLIQFGMSAVVYKPETSRYCSTQPSTQASADINDSFEAQTYNFYVFPKPAGKGAPDAKFTCQV